MNKTFQNSMHNQKKRPVLDGKLLLKFHPVTCHNDKNEQGESSKF